MTDSVQQSSTWPMQSSKKRKLKHPRTSRACLFCRRRKIRCIGGIPSCTACLEEGCPCDYSTDLPSRRKKSLADNEVQSPSVPRDCSESTPNGKDAPYVAPPLPDIHPNSVGQSRQTSTEPPNTTFDNGLHIGPTSGVSFLYRWQEGVAEGPQDNREAVPIAKYGDVPLPRPPKAPLPSFTEGRSLIDHYFKFAMPTFRFFHQQTLERWMEDLILCKVIAPVRAASVLIVWAQALIYSERASTGDPSISQRSLSFFEQARTLLTSEPGPAQVASVESRLATCLYLLSLSHIVECRFLFGFTHTLVISLGLHRKTPEHYSFPPLELERRKRAFWSFYAIDGYMSVMLGQPRQLQDKDIDQAYPENIEDHILDGADDLTQVPHHGNLEAFVYHAKIARFMARSNDLLHPIQHLTEEDIIENGESMVKSLQEWEDNLPAFLKPRPTASLGMQTWERQNSVLGLALAHCRILATRQCLLLDSSLFSTDEQVHRRHEVCIAVCRNAICDIIDRIHPMMHHGRLLGGFWLTQYFALCAISTMFVYKIQRRREIVPSDGHGRQDLSTYYHKAEEVQDYLSHIAPTGSQAKRHHNLLGRLRQKANKTRNTRAVEKQQQQPIEGNGIRGDDYNMAYSDIPGHVPLTESLTDDSFTPSNLFNITFPDASTWQYLDQLGPALELDAMMWKS